MEKDLCGYARELCIENCPLLESAKSQANVGGYKDTNLNDHQGPIWMRGSWERFTTSTLIIAREEGCIRLEELTTRVAQITKAKIQNNQLLD